MQGAYRFFQNGQVNLETLLQPHVEATLERIKEQRVVLAVQDTTSLNYTRHPAEEGMGPINTTQDGGEGLLLHDTLTFTVEGRPLGLLDVQCWARDPEEAGKRHRRKELPIEQKESMKWLRSYRAVSEVQALCPDTTLVSVGDREADLYELFAEAAQSPQGPKLLVRAEKSRNRSCEGVGEEAVGELDRIGEARLWERMQGDPVAGYQEVLIPRRGKRAARTAKLSVRFAAVTLQPPKKKDLSPVQVWAVYVEEVEFLPTVKEPVSWMLRTL